MMRQLCQRQCWRVLASQLLALRPGRTPEVQARNDRFERAYVYRYLAP